MVYSHWIIVTSSEGDKYGGNAPNKSAATAPSATNVALTKAELAAGPAQTGNLCADVIREEDRKIDMDVTKYHVPNRASLKSAVLDRDTVPMFGQTDDHGNLVNCQILHETTTAAKSSSKSSLSGGKLPNSMKP